MSSAASTQNPFAFPGSETDWDHLFAQAGDDSQAGHDFLGNEHSHRAESCSPFWGVPHNVFDSYFDAR
ncbi:MAG: hypothetical protein GXP37_10905 [Chloroflexi bacterium]|nr:hypothetical protein [Chloroflexota bacterium]